MLQSIAIVSVLEHRMLPAVLTCAVQYQKGDVSPFCVDAAHAIHAPHRTEDNFGAHSASLERKLLSHGRVTVLDSAVAETVLYGTAIVWDFFLRKMEADVLTLSILKPSSIHDNMVQSTRRLFLGQTPRPRASEHRRLSQQDHISVLIGPITASSVKKFFIGEAHSFREAVAATSFFPFIRLMSLWCMYMCKIGAREDMWRLVVQLHVAGVAHRAGNEEQYAVHRKAAVDLSASMRREMFDIMNGQGEYMRFGL